jgi:hypothetical protein
MPRRLLSAVPLAAATLLISAPVPSSASTRVFHPENGATITLGPRLIVSTFARHALAVEFRGNRTTSYSTGARTSSTRVVARFGRLGVIDLDFEPTGHPIEQQAGGSCHGDPQLTWNGVFTGKVVLLGRHGFRTFRDRSLRAKGIITHTPRRVCREPPEPRPPPARHGNGILLTASACDGRSFIAEGERPGAAGGSGSWRSVFYFARASLRERGLTIEQSVTATGRPETFSFDEALTTATVTPPDPFHGTATMVATADGSTTWSGTLSASILGERISLAGRTFATGLESFPLIPGAGYAAVVSIGCRRQEKVGRGSSPAGRDPRQRNPLLRPHLSALLPSGAR